MNGTVKDITFQWLLFWCLHHQICISCFWLNCHSGQLCQLHHASAKLWVGYRDRPFLPFSRLAITLPWENDAAIGIVLTPTVNWYGKYRNVSVECSPSRKQSDQCKARERTCDYRQKQMFMVDNKGRWGRQSLYFSGSRKLCLPCIFGWRYGQL